MNRVVLVVPGRLDTSTGGYGYDRHIVAGLRRREWSVDVRQLAGSFPRPTAADLEGAASVFAGLADDSLVIVDGLALGAMPEVVAHEAGRLHLIGLVHHPLADETGLPAAEAAELEASERRALGFVRRVVVTSAATARTLARYNVTPSRIAVVEPGTDRAPVAAGSGGNALQMLGVGSIVPRKGYAVLFEALARLEVEIEWRLTVVGSVERDPPLVARLRAQLAADRLDGRVCLAGETDERGMAACYNRADLFITPTLYEGYGMAVAEAIARGLPVIGTPTGGIPNLLADGAGLLVPIGDVPALAGAIRRVLTEPAVLGELKAGALRARDRLPDWDATAARMERVLTNDD
jgi:glycosyltransferase involved in cell wall biosynthesis